MSKDNINAANEDFSARREARMKLIRGITASAFAAFFIAGLLCGALNPVHKTYSKSQATLVVIANVIGLAFLAIPLLFRKVFRLGISFFIVLPWWAFVMCHSLGETFEFYYKLPGWDKMLHLVSGILQFLLFYGMARSYLAAKNAEGKFFMSLMFAIAASLATGCLWEIIEFSIDSLFGTNMQKFIPEEFFNGGNAFCELKGSAEEIAAYYSTPRGYKFALADTMYDCLNCLAGTVIGGVLTFCVTRKKPAFLERAFTVIPRKREKDER